MPPKKDPEQFIHDDLLKKAKELLVTLRQQWRKDQDHLASLAIAWPGERVHMDDGTATEGQVFMPLDDVAQAERKGALSRFAKRTHAFGLFVVENHKQTVDVRFETTKHTFRWQMQVERHGDVNRLGPTQTLPGDLWVLQKNPQAS